MDGGGGGKVKVLFLAVALVGGRPNVGHQVAL